MAPPGTRTYSVSVTADVALTSAVEATVLTLPGVNTDNVSQIVSLIGTVSILTAAGATSCTLRWRRSGLTGTLVGEANLITMAATTSFLPPLSFDDTPGEVASLPYVLTATMAGGNGTMQAG